MACSPHPLNAQLKTLREAAALPLRAVLDPFGARLPMAACRSVGFAWLAILYDCRRERLDPPEDLIAARLERAQRLLPPQRWQHYAEKFEREVAA